MTVSDNPPLLDPLLTPELDCVKPFLCGLYLCCADDFEALSTLWGSPLYHIMRTDTMMMVPVAASIEYLDVMPKRFKLLAAFRMARANRMAHLVIVSSGKSSGEIA